MSRPAERPDEGERRDEDDPIAARVTRPAERPILFSDAMVREIIAGRKTQTRRVVQRQPSSDPTSHEYAVRAETVTEGGRFGGVYFGDRGYSELVPCPYDAEALWVREAWRPCMEGWRTYVEYRANGGSLNIPSGPAHDALSALPKLSLRFPGARKERHSDAWRPSIHLPRWASRITLHGVTVRVERLNAISEADARAEGCETAPDTWELVHPEEQGIGWPQPQTYRAGFRRLWDSINAARGYPWASNPWTWVVGWERAEVRT